MILVYIDIIIFIVLLYVNYKKYKFSTEFNIKQETGLATFFFIAVIFGITIPAITGIIVKFSLTKTEFSEIYRSYSKLRFPIYWILGLFQLIYLFIINSIVKSRRK